MLRIISPYLGSNFFTTGRIDPWSVQKRFMGGAKKSMARARKNFAKKQKKEVRARYLSKREVVPALDKELRKHTKMRMVWNVKLILASRNGHVIPSIEFARLSRELGFPRPNMFPQFIEQFPGIFKLTRDTQERHVRWLEFSSSADMLVDEEERIMQSYHEPLIVTNLRKLLMMVPARRLLLNKLAHIRPSFWMPDDFRTSIIPKYPELFNITGGYVELLADDKSLAVTTRERQCRGVLGYRPNNMSKDRSGESSRYAFRISFERHKVLDSSTAARMLAFQQLPFPSPYEPIGDLDIRSVQGQKRAVGVCHEFLSFTVEKRAYVDHLSFFKKELFLPDKLEDMLARFPHIFYVCMRGDRHVVFLKEYYRNGELIEKHPLIDIKNRFAKLMTYTTLSRRPVHPIHFTGICAENFIAPRHHLENLALPPSSGPLDAQGSPPSPSPPIAPVQHIQPFQQLPQPEPSPAQQSCEPGALRAWQGGQPFQQLPQAQQSRESWQGCQPFQQLPQREPSPAQQSREPGALRAWQGGQPFQQPRQPEPVAPRQGGEPFRQLEPLPDQQGGGLFLQLGFSDDDDSEPNGLVPANRQTALVGVKQKSLGQKLGIMSDDDSEDERKATGAMADIWGGWRSSRVEPDEEEEGLGKRRKKRNKKPFWKKRPLDNFDDPFF